MSLYQSQLRKDIQEIIYQKPSFKTKLFGKEYFGTIKTKSFGPLKIQRYQILGIQLPSDQKEVKKELENLKNKFHGKKNILFQLGFTNEIVSFDNKIAKCEEFKEEVKEIRLGLEKIIQKDYEIFPAFRENMPQSGMLYFVDRKDEELMADMNGGCKERTKKAIKEGIEFREIQENELKVFYEKRSQTADKKGFNIIPFVQYKRLVEYLLKNNAGKLFVVTKDNEIIAGNICGFYDKKLVYLYGFADRKFNNIGGQHFLKFKIFGRARDNGIGTCDMMGGAPTGFPHHPLHSVSTFKESLGGTKIEYYGSYDLVLNPILYKIFKRYYKLKHE